MERVHGIGGFFFRAQDPKALAQWYNDHLGVDLGSWHQEAGDTAFEPFPADTSYFGRMEQMWMINFRVGNLAAMVAQLQSAGVEVEVDPEEYPYGLFATLHDPEGNPIQLWQSNSPPLSG